MENKAFIIFGQTCSPITVLIKISSLEKNYYNLSHKEPSFSVKDANFTIEKGKETIVNLLENPTELEKPLAEEVDYDN